jgi:hypothetical protein
MLAALQKRVDIKTIFEDEALARELVLASGGCIRDLMHLMEQALLASEERIDRLALEQGVRTVRAAYTRELGTEDYELLARVHLRKTVASDEAHRQLLFRRDVLEYNYTEDRWADVHPLLLGTEEFKNALAKEKRKSGHARAGKRSE